MKTLFTKFIDGYIPSYKIAENEQFYSFLDINPVQAGHTLVIPKRNVDYFFDLSDSELQEMIIFAKRISEQIKNSLGCVKVAVVVLGMEVPHAHIHLIPMNNEGDANFYTERKKFSPEEFLAIQEKITKG